MAKKSLRKSVVKNATPKLPQIIVPPNIHEDRFLNSVNVHNGLGNALGAPNANGLPGGWGPNPYAPQISQVNTMFDNLRWYPISNMRQPISQAYLELGLVQTVVDVPVDDGLRGGIEINSKQLDETQILELSNHIDREDDVNTAGQAAKWNRLYGGAGILIITDQDPETVLNLAAIKKDTEMELRAVDMWELFWDKQNTEGYDPTIQAQDFEFYSYYSENVHKSRVMRLKGMIPPSFLRPRFRGWGFSILEMLIRSINQYLKATDLSFACLDEFKVDVYKIKNLVNTLLSPQGEQQVAQRIALSNWQKNYQNALIMDSEDDWDHKQLSFSGLAETMQQIRMQVAADMRMPITKLFGTSASAGIGNQDQNDMENYNAMVESQVRNKLKYDLLRIVEIRSQQLFGFIPEDLSIEFKPLRVLSAEQEENVKTQKFNRLVQMCQLGKIDDKTLIDACNKDNLLGVQINTNEMLLNPVDPEVGEIAEDNNTDPYKSVDRDDPGSNREDRRSPYAWEFGGMSESPKPAKQANEFLALAPTDPAGQPGVAALPNPPAMQSPDAQKIVYKPEFDAMSYVQEGGDDWINQNQMQLFRYPTDSDLWQHAKDASLRYLKTNNLKFQIWWYRKNGGRFGDGPMKNGRLPDGSLQKEDQPMNNTYMIPSEDIWNDARVISNPGKVDEGKWKKAKEASRKEYGEVRWPVVTTIYKEMGGAFK